MNPLSTPHDAHAPPLRRWPQTGYPAMLTATAAWHDGTNRPHQIYHADPIAALI